MKRMALIAVVLCAVLVATVAAGVVTAKQGMNPGKHNGADQGRGCKRGVGVGGVPGSCPASFKAEMTEWGKQDEGNSYRIDVTGTWTGATSPVIVYQVTLSNAANQMITYTNGYWPSGFSSPVRMYMTAPKPLPSPPLRFDFFVIDSNGCQSATATEFIYWP